MTASKIVGFPSFWRRWEVLPWLFIGFAPVLFALATWGDLNPADNLRLVGVPLSFLELGFLGLAVHAGWRPVRQFMALSPVVRLLLVAIVVIAFGTAAFRAPSPIGSFVWTYLSLIHLLFGFGTAWAVADADGQIRGIIWPTVVCGCFLYAAMVGAFALSPHRADFDWQFFGLAVSNVRQIGFYMVVGTLAAIGCGVNSRPRWAILFAGAATIMMVVSFWTGSRGALVAALAAIAAGYIVFPRMRTFHAILSALIPIFLGALLSIPLPRPVGVFGIGRMVDSIHASSPDEFSAFRLRMWEGAWHAFLRRPGFGYGEGQFGIVVPQPQGAYLHPHNVVLQSLIQWGLAGTTLTLGLVLVATARLRKVLHGGQAGVLPAFLVLIGLIVFSFYDGALFHTYPVMMFSFALAFILGSDQSSGAVGEPYLSDQALETHNP